MTFVSRALHPRRTSGSPNTSAHAPKPQSHRTFAALGFRNFRLFWWGQVVSVTGTFMQSTAQQWLVLTLTKNPLALGVTGALQFGPSLIVGPFAGALIDRYPRRNILFATQIISGILAAALWLLTMLGVVQLWHVYVLALMLGLVTAIDNPTRQAFVSEMVPSSHLLNAISLNSVQFNVARIIGPAVAGELIAILGIPLMFLLNALSFIAVIFGLWAMRTQDLYLTPRRADASKGMRAMGEGMRFIWANHNLRITMLMVAIIGTMGFNFNVLLPLLAKLTLHAGSQEFGMLTSALGAGALAGALGLARRGGRPTPRILLGTAALFGILESAAGLSSSLFVTLILIAATGAMMSTFAASANTTMQLSSPPEMRGRTMSVYTTIFIGTTPIGNLATSSLAAAFGVPVAFIFSGVPCLLAAGLAGWLWRREKLAHPSPPFTAGVDNTQIALESAALTRESSGVEPPTTTGVEPSASTGRGSLQ